MSNIQTHKNSTVESLLQADSTKEQIRQSLPSDISPERYARIALTEVRVNPKLQKCDPFSFMGALFKSSELGLYPGNTLGHAYLIPYGRECNLIIGYKGMIELARKSGQIKTLYAKEVYENDLFEYEQGTENKLKHVPTLKDRGEVIAYYALANLKDGTSQFEIMNIEDIESIREGSKSGKSGPWVSHYGEMAKKTVIRRLFKYLPVSVEVTKAVGMDEQADVGVQDNANFARRIMDKQEPKKETSPEIKEVEPENDVPEDPSYDKEELIEKFNTLYEEKYDKFSHPEGWIHTLLERAEVQDVKDLPGEKLAKAIEYLEKK